MEKIIDWLTEKFSSPLSLLFFVLGALLLLLGLSTGFEIPYLEKHLSSANGYQGASLILGGVCLLLALFIYYKPPQKKTQDKDISREMREDEFPSSFFARKDLVSKTQKKLLEYIEKHDSILFLDLQNEFNRLGMKELFYRLEQLRLMGFVEKDKIGNPDTKTVGTQVYHLSEKYKKEIKEKIGHLNRDTSTGRISTKRLRDRRQSQSNQKK